MTFFYVNILAIVQGATEFLPVSSSGHLLILSKIFDQPNQTLQVDVAAHFGSLIAIILYYKNDVASLLSGTVKTFTYEFNHNDARFLRLIFLGTIPVVVAGFFLKSNGLIYELRSLKTIGYGMIIFGIILYLADKYGKQNRVKKDWSFLDALIMGLWQAVALVPGTSRSGNTISGGMFLGFSRESSVNLSMIMSIPTILASSVLLSIDFVTVNFQNSELSVLILSTFLSFLASLAALSILVKFVKTHNFTLFVVYRLLLGMFILYLAYH